MLLNKFIYELEQHFLVAVGADTRLYLESYHPVRLEKPSDSKLTASIGLHSIGITWYVSGAELNTDIRTELILAEVIPSIEKYTESEGLIIDSLTGINIPGIIGIVCTDRRNSPEPPLIEMPSEKI